MNDSDDPDAPLLPASSTENELRDAVGARTVKEPEVYGNPAPPPHAASLRGAALLASLSAAKVPVAPVASPLFDGVTPVEPGAASGSDDPSSTSLPPDGSTYPAPLTGPTLAYPPIAAQPSDGAAEGAYPPVASQPTYGTAPGAPPRDAQTKKQRKTRPPTDGDDTPHRSRKPVVVTAVAVVFAIGIGALVFLGRINAGNYALVCEPEQVTAMQGRGFPPWGMRDLAGAEWKPIALPPEAECRPHETENLDELAGWYLGLLSNQASALLTAREVTKVDLAEAQLKQALLLARSPEKRDERKEVERLLGDVEYWRALAALRDATTRLGDAAGRFEAAAAQRPRHVSDAGAWALYIRKVADELKVGPAGARTSVVPPVEAAPTRSTAPAGVALPVEPQRPVEAPVAPAPDAGVPSGGVLL